ncbi:MAG: DUF6351 family protein, partial [Gemmatimonadota bacterium]
VSVDQFLHLNEHVGGYDHDANYTEERSVGDDGAIRRAHRSGLQLGGGGGLASIPVFDITGIYNEDSAYHYQWFHFALRERMRRSNGDTGNHVMWRGNPVPFDSAWSAFVGWVDAWTSDADPGTRREKVLRNRPADLVDGCWTASADPERGERLSFLAERQTLDHHTGEPGESVSRCNELYPSWTFPREGAGGPVAADVLKCELKPLAREDYAVTFTDDQWARLERIFPDGVCDWSRPGVHAAPVVPNGSFGPAEDGLVFRVGEEPEGSAGSADSAGAPRSSGSSGSAGASGSSGSESSPEG